MRKISWVSGTVNLDYGGGKYSTATDYLKTRGVTNLVYDPYNRDDDHNGQVLSDIWVDRTVEVSTVTLCNVLNVIKEPLIRRNVLFNIYAMTNRNRRSSFSELILYVSCYRGKKAEPGATCNGWQENRPLHTYLDEVRQYFPRAVTAGQMIVAPY
jgi:hypothetical protein